MESWSLSRSGGLILGSLVVLVGCGPRATPIQNTGSNTMVDLARAWAEAYGDVDTTVSIEVSGTGSGEGISSLINGTVDVANASRDISEAEKAMAKTNTGKEPLEHTVAYDGIGIYINKDNPLEEISFEELAGIYGQDGTITKWSQLGIDHSKLCPSDEIVRVSRMSNSGTYVYFREHVLEKKDFKSGSRDLPGSEDVVKLVGSTPCAIGYSGMGYKTDDVKFVKVCRKKGEPAIEPTIENVLSGAYPLARPLYMYTLGEGKPEAQKYIAWILSPAGQEIVAKCGYVPVPAKDAKDAATK